MSDLFLINSEKTALKGTLFITFDVCALVSSQGNLGSWRFTISPTSCKVGKQIFKSGIMKVREVIGK